MAEIKLKKCLICGRVIEVAEEYFNSNANKTNASISRFDKLIAKASKKLGKTPPQKTHKASVNSNKISSQPPVNTNTMSNDELLFKYADLYEKGLLTRDEFDRKKKELLFADSVSEPAPANVNDNTFENDITSNIDENDFDSPIITISCSNFTKLLKYNTGDIVIVKNRRDKIKMEIVKNDNPGYVYEYLDSNMKLTVVKENFSVIRSLNIGELITIKCKGKPQEVVLKRDNEM